MATNKNALIRYRTIDKCLQNRSRKWTLDDLIEACSDALYEFEGKDSNVSKRTVQLDIQVMRSDKLGYNAPIIVTQNRYYTYEDEEYSITAIPITQLDMDILTESMEVLSQFKDFSLFAELNGVIQKLEDKIFRESGNQTAIIHMEKNENLKGLEHLDPLYQAILKKIVLFLTYQSFRAQTSETFLFHGFILKEFNNRWFLIGQREGRDKVMTLALDRILKVEFDARTIYHDHDFDAEAYYKDTYGVTVLNDAQLMDIVIKVDRNNAPYVVTKPFHHSQQVLENHPNGSVTISISVHLNYEIERLLLGFGASIEVIKPLRLRNKMKRILKSALNNYVEG